MTLEYFNPDSETADIVLALKRDGAAVVTEQIAPEIADAVLAELRDPFDQVGEFPYRCGPHPEMTGVIKVVE